MKCFPPVVIGGDYSYYSFDLAYTNMDKGKIITYKILTYPYVDS